MIFFKISILATVCILSSCITNTQGHVYTPKRISLGELQKRIKSSKCEVITFPKPRDDLKYSPEIFGQNYQFLLSIQLFDESTSKFSRKFIFSGKTDEVDKIYSYLRKGPYGKDLEVANNEITKDNINLLKNCLNLDVGKGDFVIIDSI